MTTSAKTASLSASQQSGLAKLQSGLDSWAFTRDQVTTQIQGMIDSWAVTKDQVSGILWQAQGVQQPQQSQPLVLPAPTPTQTSQWPIPPQVQQQQATITTQQQSAYDKLQSGLQNGSFTPQQVQQGIQQGLASWAFSQEKVQNVTQYAQQNPTPITPQQTYGENFAREQASIDVQAQEQQRLQLAQQQQEARDLQTVNTIADLNKSIMESMEAIQKDSSASIAKLTTEMASYAAQQQETYKNLLNDYNVDRQTSVEIYEQYMNTPELKQSEEEMNAKEKEINDIRLQIENVQDEALEELNGKAPMSKIQAIASDRIGNLAKEESRLLNEYSYLQANYDSIATDAQTLMQLTMQDQETADAEKWRQIEFTYGMSQDQYNQQRDLFQTELTQLQRTEDRAFDQVTRIEDRVYAQAVQLEERQYQAGVVQDEREFAIAQQASDRAYNESLIADDRDYSRNLQLDQRTYEQLNKLDDREYAKEMQEFSVGLWLEEKSALLNMEFADAQRTTEWMYAFSKQNPTVKFIEDGDGGFIGINETTAEVLTSYNHTEYTNSGALLNNDWFLGKDITNLASSYPWQAWAKNNNPAWLTWGISSWLKDALNKAGVSYWQGTSRPANEGWSYIKFDTIWDGIEAMKVALTRWDNTINSRLQAWVGTSEWPAYARQVMGNAGLDSNSWQRFSDLDETQMNNLVLSVIKKESPWLAKELESAGVDNVVWGSTSTTGGGAYNANLWPTYMAYAQKGSTPTQWQIDEMGGIEEFGKQATSYYVEKTTEKYDKLGFDFKNPQLLIASDAKTRETIEKDLTEFAKYKDAFDAVMDEVENNGLPLQWKRGDGKRLQGQITQLHLYAKGEEQFNLWVLTWPDLDLLENVIPSISVGTKINGKENFLNQMSDARAVLIDSYNKALNAQGIYVKGENTTASTDPYANFSQTQGTGSINNFLSGY